MALPPTVPIAERIKKFNLPLSTETVNRKYALMKKGPFEFFQNTCHLFYEDLEQIKMLPPSPLVWLCGSDLHPRVSEPYQADARLQFLTPKDLGISVLGHANWELTRMLSGIFLLLSQHRTDKASTKKIASKYLKIYAATLKKASEISRFDIIAPNGIVEARIDEITRNTQNKIVKKHTEKVNGKRRLVHDLNSTFPAEREIKRLLRIKITQWLNEGNPSNQYIATDVLYYRGIGYRVLVEEKKNAFLLEMIKSEYAHVYLPLKTADSMRSKPPTLINIPLQIAVKNIAFSIMGIVNHKETTYIVSELSPAEYTVDINSIWQRTKKKAAVREMAVLTASAHIRSSGRLGAAPLEELIAFGMNKTWQKFVLGYAETYAAKVKQDYESFVRSMINDRAS